MVVEEEARSHALSPKAQVGYYHVVKLYISSSLIQGASVSADFQKVYTLNPKPTGYIYLD